MCRFSAKESDTCVQGMVGNGTVIGALAFDSSRLEEQRKIVNPQIGFCEGWAERAGNGRFRTFEAIYGMAWWFIRNRGVIIQGGVEDSTDRGGVA